MKLLVLSDIHQRYFKWSHLAEAVKKEKPDITCIAGDLVANDSFFEFKKFIDKTVFKYAQEIKRYCPYLMLVPGNDDHSEVTDYLMTTKGADDLWYNVHDRVIHALGLDFAGVPYVLDHPFGYKYWSVRETDEELKINPFQLSNKFLATEKGVQGYVKIPDYAQFLMSKPSMKTVLEELSKKVSDINYAVFLIHCPPIGCGLDITSRGDICGSGSVTKFIMDKQPLLTVHGHIHESPHYTGKWCCNLDKTWTIQAGQIENELYYAVVTVEDGKVVGLKHSIYGEMKI
jgi:Icc-related predicted phosphoesterase